MGKEELKKFLQKIYNESLEEQEEERRKKSMMTTKEGNVVGIHHTRMLKAIEAFGKEDGNEEEE